MGFLLSLLSFLFFTWPHGDLQLRIDELSKSIVQHPDSLELFLSRGELYLQHESFLEAEHDFSFCLQHGLSNTRVLEGMSKSLAVTAQTDSSLYFINLALREDPASLSAMEWKARIYFLVRRFCESAQLYEEIIGLTSSPSPSLYLDAAKAWINCTDPDGPQHAVAILNKGLIKIGTLHVLQKELVQVYLLQKDFKNALILQSQLVDHAVNKTLPLFERATIYLTVGYNEKAKEDLEQALLALDQLPEHKKSIPAMMELRNKIEHQLLQLKG